MANDSQSDSVPQQIAKEVDRLRDSLGPSRYSQVEELASRFYELYRSVFDLARRHALITDEAYEKCMARGPNCAPMCWIIRDFV
jgi:hypothetical protein